MQPDADEGKVLACMSEYNSLPLNLDVQFIADIMN